MGPDGLAGSPVGRSGPLIRLRWRGLWPRAVRDAGSEPRRRVPGVTKRYDEPIEVTGAPGPPVAFQWRGRRYDVDEHLSWWREAGEWWTGSAAKEREYHRLLARPAGVFASGDLDADGFMQSPSAVFDIYRDRIRGGWHLARVWD
jgi:uncharacterized protein DUF6504